MSRYQIFPIIYPIQNHLDDGGTQSVQKYFRVVDYSTMCQRFQRSATEGRYIDNVDRETDSSTPIQGVTACGNEPKSNQVGL